METCSKCQIPFELDEDQCPCNGSLCTHCCECDDGCGCGCKNEGCDYRE